jgi:hypothetical protein
MPRQKKTYSEGSSKQVGDFSQMMASLFTEKQFGQWISRCGLTTKDSRRLCEAFRKLKD